MQPAQIFESTIKQRLPNNFKATLQAGLAVLLLLFINNPADANEAETIAAQKTVSDIEKSMVTIPAGSFSMGCVSGKGCSDHEKPVRKVIVLSFVMQSTEVTYKQWDACVKFGPCNKPKNAEQEQEQERHRDALPVVYISWEDAQTFIQWLNSVSQGGYRLPTEAEWEYAARADSQTKYSWGNNIGDNQANCNGCGSQWDNQRSAPVASFSPNAFGLYDMHGNVWEWTQDCWNASYLSAPSYGGSWLNGNCGQRVVRGGAWNFSPRYLRAANRNRDGIDVRYYNLGFRLVRDL